MTTDRGRLLGVDYGERRIGLAISDPTGTIASPAGVIVRRAGKRPPVAEIVRRAEALEARGFVMGLPLDGNGDETPRSTEARAVADELGKRTGLAGRADRRTLHARRRRCAPFVRWAARRADRKGDVDALAATVLLQTCAATWRLSRVAPRACLDAPRTRRARRGLRRQRRTGRCASRFRPARPCASRPTRCRKPASCDGGAAVSSLRIARAGAIAAIKAGTYVLHREHELELPCSTRCAAAKGSCTS